MTNTIVVMITGNTRRAAEPTQLLLEEHHRDWSASGLHVPSVVNCSNIYTVEQSYVSKIIGTLSFQTMKEIDNCLRIALGL